MNFSDQICSYFYEQTNDKKSNKITDYMIAKNIHKVIKPLHDG